MTYLTLALHFRIVKEPSQVHLTCCIWLLPEVNTLLYNKCIYFWLEAIGGAREDRTPDLLRARQALSQLSYGP